MKCVNCGEIMRRSDRYCRNCGIKVKSNSYYIIANIFIIFIIIIIILIGILFAASFVV